MDRNNNTTSKSKSKTKSPVLYPTDTDASVDDGEVVLSQQTKELWHVRKLECDLTDNNKKLEGKIDKLTSALVVMQDMMQKQGKDKSGNVQLTIIKSGTTIYHNAVPPIEHNDDIFDRLMANLDLDLSKRFSSSSEEGQIDTSDEVIDVNCNNIDIVAGANMQSGKDSGPKDDGRLQPSTSDGRHGYMPGWLPHQVSQWSKDRYP